MLKDSDAYILFYARDDPARDIGKVEVASNGLHSSPSITKPNGLGVNGSSGKKRPMEESTDSRSKRQRQSDDEDDDLEITPSPQISSKSLTSINKRNIPAKPLATTQRTYGNNLSNNYDQISLHTTTHKPYGPKVIPTPPKPNPLQVTRGSESRFFQQLSQHDNLPKSTTNQQQPSTKKQNPRPQPPKRPTNQLETTSINPYIPDPDKDPFAHGFSGGQRGFPVRYPGVASQLRPGATSSFLNDRGSSHSMLSNNDGIKIKRRDKMR